MISFDKTLINFLEGFCFPVSNPRLLLGANTKPRTKKQMHAHGWKHENKSFYKTKKYKESAMFRNSQTEI